VDAIGLPAPNIDVEGTANRNLLPYQSGVREAVVAPVTPQWETSMTYVRQTGIILLAFSSLGATRAGNTATA